MLQKIIEGVLNKDSQSIAKAISIIENEIDKSQELVEMIHKETGKAVRIGVTGPSGVGKSSIINEMALILKSGGFRVGIIAVDPSSAFSGGAFLGDRVRMSKINEDASIFIRSMATRGHRGGIAKATCDTADILDASGRDYILIETVGIGQSDIDISNYVDLTIVVVSPESGDSIQAMKSGLMEIADFIIINKSDRPGGELLKSDIKTAVELSIRRRNVTILLTQANIGKGVDELIKQMYNFIGSAKSNGAFIKRRKMIAQNRVRSICEYLLSKDLWSSEEIKTSLQSLADDVITAKKSHYEAAKAILKLLGRSV